MLVASSLARFALRVFYRQSCTAVTAEPVIEFWLSVKDTPAVLLGRYRRRRRPCRSGSDSGSRRGTGSRRGADTLLAESAAAAEAAAAADAAPVAAAEAAATAAADAAAAAAPAAAADAAPAAAADAAPAGVTLGLFLRADRLFVRKQARPGATNAGGLMSGTSSLWTQPAADSCPEGSV